MPLDHASFPLDEVSAAAVASHGLRMALVDTSDTEAFAVWTQAEVRGFHAPALDDDGVNDFHRSIAYRRTTGVWDDSAEPVATTNSWPAELAVPGGVLDAWAISGVTVAPTHRRLGLATALLEAELRTASALGHPLAMITVTESTIYGRFGFAPAALATNLVIDTPRARWQGPATSGRLSFVAPETAMAEASALHDRVRRSSPGQVETWPGLWQRLFAQRTMDKEAARALRSVVHRDETGTVRGVALYRVTENEASFSAHAVDLRWLSAETPDAYAALWRFVLELDLVSTVTASLRPVDEPMRWMVADFRSVATSIIDHLWLRVLDVAATLEARTYAAPDELVFEVSDPLGFATGRFLLRTGSDGHGVVARLDGTTPAGAAAVSLTVNELGALYLGGVSAATLAAAGRLRELRVGSAERVDATFRATTAPWSNLWF